MLYPTDLKYSKSHEWVKMEDGVAVIARHMNYGLYRVSSAFPTLHRTPWAMWCS